jgi:hypothetical protein
MSKENDDKKPVVDEVLPPREKKEDPNEVFHPLVRKPWWIEELKR